MQKIVVHRDWGWFTLSEKANSELRRLNPCLEWVIDDDIRTDTERDDPWLVCVVESLGREAWHNLEVVEIPDNVERHIENNDGFEKIVEDRRSR